MAIGLLASPLEQQCPSISLTLAVGASMTLLMVICRINDTYCCYHTLMHGLSILRSYQSASLIASRNVTNTMLVWDTGASIGLTPFRSDFIDYLPLEGVTVKDIARANSMLGIGTVMWKLPTTKGRPVFVPMVAYHMPDCNICLFSP